MNNLYHHDGNPRAVDFWCDTSNVLLSGDGSVSCRFESVSDDAHVKPYSECSDHGECDHKTGVCECHDGFYGENCADSKDEEDVLVAPAKGPFFSGNVLRVTAQRDLSADFNLIKADAAGRTLFTLNGEGTAAFYHGSLHVNRGDLVLQHGSLQVLGGGALELDGSRMRLKNSRLHVNQLDLADGDSSGDAAPLLHLEMRIGNAQSTDTPDFLRISQPRGPVFRVTGTGNTIIHEGGLEVLKGGIRLERGGLQVLSDGVRVRSGGLELRKDDLTLGSGSINVLNGRLTLRAPGSGPALRILQRVDESGANNVPVFEVADSGVTTVHSGGLRVLAGGLEVASGGQVITSGGLRIESGGIHIESGGLTTNDGFTIEKGGLTVKNSDLNGAVLRLAATDARYAGALLELDLANQSPSSLPAFRLIEARDSRDNLPSVFALDSRGNLETRGDVVTADGGKVVADGALIANSQLTVTPLVVRAGNGITIPTSHSYVRVADDGDSRGAPNAVRIDTSSAYSGQLLLVQNEDDDAITGDLNLHPGSTAMLVFDGTRWQMLSAGSNSPSALSAASLVSDIHHQSSTEHGDSNVGGRDVKLMVESLEVTGRDAGFVAIYGKGGQLAQDEQLRFDSSTSTLKVDQLEMRRVRGSIDMTQSVLHGVDIIGGHISGVNMTDIDTVEVQGELFVESEAYFGAGITVDGHVMGSGAYVDASDARFKKDVVSIRNASQLLSQLHGVEYSWQADAFPNRKFAADTRELGFIAQEVEKVVPQVVAADSDGFKHVAYARLVPVVVEAFKSEQQRVTSCLSDVEDLRNEVKQLRQDMEAQQRAIERLYQALLQRQDTASSARSDQA